MILPATAQANDGYCAPCVGKRRKAEHDEYVKKHRVRIDPYEGVSDPVEMIRILLAPRKYDPLIEYAPAPKTIEELFSELSAEQEGKLVNIAAETMRFGSEDMAAYLAKCLAMLTDQCLDDMLEAWMIQGNYYPAVIFRSASAGIRDRILEAIRKGTCNVSHALSALAWIGDATVQLQFAEWEKRPPKWRKELYVGPAVYAHDAGWELRGQQRRDLFYQSCLALTVADADEPASEVHLLTETSQSCPWCQDTLIYLLEIPGRVPVFEFLHAGTVLPVLACERCACYGEHWFAKVAPDGQAAPHPANSKPDSRLLTGGDWVRGPWQGIPVKLKPRSVMQAVDWCMPVPISQIGGIPGWVQDTAYPQCPDCEQAMMFLAQLDNGYFPHHEGVYYAFWCSACRNTAVTYQQT